MSLAEQEKPREGQSSALDWHSVPETTEFGGGSPLLLVGFAPKELWALQLKAAFQGLLLCAGGTENALRRNYC